MRLDEVLAGNYAYLYHGTLIFAVAGIIEHGAILATQFPGQSWPTPHDKNLHKMGVMHDGVRVSRSYTVAQKFAVKDDGVLGMDAGGVFVFDTALVRQKYKIVQYQDRGVAGRGYGDEMHEAEEIVVAPELNLEPFCTKLVFSSAELDRYATRTMYEEGAHWDAYGEESMTYDGYLKVLQSILDYPKRVDTWTRP